uniref:NADH-ubiquinone oxidoreductase chain 2 n=1 Tax=Tryonicus parvus TaxID=1554535 RepID=A0A2P1H9R5_9NEOP|nr:NADH dehydrogenase subunit 2 [Tryonicus parvus]
MLLLLTLVGGMLISVSSNSWLGAWIGLEINLLSFIPLMSSKSNMYTTEASLKYFIVQALASSTLLFSVLIIYMAKETLFQTPHLMGMLVNIPLLLKGGAAPFHWWFPSVMEGLSWGNCLLLLTMQKIAPLMLISYSLSMSWFTTMIILLSVWIGAVGGMNQTSVRKILTYSSINHMGWMISSMLISESMWMTYFSIYSFLTFTIILMVKPFKVSFITQTITMNKDNPTIKFMMFMILLSLGGLPPFIGFLPKWMVIQFMIMKNMEIIATVMVLTSLITLYYYLRLCYSSFMIGAYDVKWNNQFNKPKILYSSMFLTSLSTMGLLLCTMTINLY